MVGKLIATDLRQSWRPIVIASALVIAFTTLGGLLVGFKVPFFASIFSLLIVIAPFALLAGILVYLLVRYYRTMYGRVGYFTHSLPATCCATLLGEAAVWPHRHDDCPGRSCDRTPAGLDVAAGLE